MADYTATARTNYFRVTDEEKYQQLFKGFTSDYGIEDFTKEENGTTYHGFGAYDSVDYRESDDPYDNYGKGLLYQRTLVTSVVS